VTGDERDPAADDGPTAGTEPPGPDPDPLQGVQLAAHQAIAAARGLLDALEALVDDPATVREAVTVIGGVAQDAARMAAEAGRRAAHGTASTPAAPTEGDDPPDEGPVARITVR